MMAIDVERAYFYARRKILVFIEIPMKDRELGDEHKAGQLNLSLYGTRDAAQNLAEEYTKTLRAARFRVGNASPAICCARERGWR